MRAIQTGRFVGVPRSDQVPAPRATRRGDRERTVDDGRADRDRTGVQFQRSHARLQCAGPRPEGHDRPHLHEVGANEGFGMGTSFLKVVARQMLESTGGAAWNSTQAFSKNTCASEQYLTRTRNAHMQTHTPSTHHLLTRWVGRKTRRAGRHSTGS